MLDKMTKMFTKYRIFMQVVTLFNLMHVLSHSLNTMSETNFSNSLIFQEFAKLKYTLNLKISKSQNLAHAKISRPKVFQFSNGTEIILFRNKSPKSI